MNTSEYFQSTEKIRKRYTQSEKKVAQDAESMDTVKLSLSEKKLKDREKSQPVRITELFGYSEKSKSCPRESVRKRLPERLNHEEKDINSNQGKQGYTKTKNSRLTINARRKLNLTESVSPNQCIQNNIKITVPVYNGKEEDTVSANNKNIYGTSVTKSNLRYSTYNINSGKKNVNNTNGLFKEPSGTENKRKSFLLPPNSIRNKHLVTENEKESLNMKNKKKSKDVYGGYKSTELTENLNVSKHMKDNTESLEISEDNHPGCKQVQDNFNLEINQEVHKGSLDKIDEDKEASSMSSPDQENIELERPSVIVKPHLNTSRSIPSKLHSMIGAKKIGGGNVSLQQENSLFPKKDIHSGNISVGKKLEKNNWSPSDTKENLQEKENIVPRQELRHSINENVKKLWIDEKDIIYVKSNLEGLICETEEKLFNLREMLKHVNKILDSSKNNEHKETSQKNVFTQVSHCILERKEQELVPEKGESLKDKSNKEVEEVVTDKCIQSISNEENISVKETEIVEKDKYALVPSAPLVANNVDECLDLAIGSKNKENLQIVNMVNTVDAMQNQGTPKELQSIYNKDDSFLNLEDQLNIIHVKALSNSSCLVITPVKRKSKWAEKSLQEYMMLKSSISFLQTPDTKRFQSKTNQNDENAVSNTLKTCISRKILTELRDLCTDSPS